MSERRQMHRQRSLLGGRIAFNGSRSTMDCLVRNISPNGARIDLSDSAPLPREFDLAIECKGLKARVEIVWRVADQIGVSFTSPESQPAVVPLDLAHRLNRSQAENLALKRRVRELSS